MGVPGGFALLLGGSCAQTAHSRTILWVGLNFTLRQLEAPRESATPLARPATSGGARTVLSAGQPPSLPQEATLENRGEQLYLGHYRNA